MNTSFSLTTAATNGTYPFSIGLGFVKGEAVAGQISCDLTNYQVTVLRAWNDGSVKHAQIAGRAALTQNVARTVNVTVGTTQTGTALTAGNIQTAAPSASIQCGSLGTVNLSSLLASPHRTFISGHEMVECHYRSAVGSTSMEAWFHVRLFADGRMWVRAFVENGKLDNGSGAIASNSAQSYVPTITINGSAVYTNGGASITHRGNKRYSSPEFYDAGGWIGGNPQVTPLHNVTYLRSSKLVPNYSWQTPTTSVLDALDQTYTPLDRGPQTLDMGDGGYQQAIGIMPHWDACYIASGDSRALKAVLVGSSSLNSYRIIWRDQTTKNVPKISSFSGWNTNGPGGSGTFSLSDADNRWELNHHPGDAYLAYLLTGDYWHYETLMMQAFAVWLCPDNTSQGSGTSRKLRAETRGMAWALRTVGMACGIAPDNEISTGTYGADFRSLLASNYTYHRGQIDANGTMIWSGSVYQYEYGNWTPTSGVSAGSVANFMQTFAPQVNGFVSDIEPLATMTDLLAVRDWMYRWVVGLLGQSGVSSEFAFTHAMSSYGIKVATDNTGGTWYQDWGAIYTQTIGSSNSSSSNALTGGNIDNGNMGVDSFWGNFIPAVAYAVDHAAAGASAGYARLSNASNWAALTAKFADFPVWGVKTRVPTTALGLAAASLSAGQCVKLSTSLLGNVLRFGSEGSNFIKWGSSAYYDPTRQEIGFIGKMEGSNPWHWLVYNEAANTWSNSRALWTSANASGHGYDHNTIDPSTGTVYFRPYGSDTVQVWTGSWSTLSAFGSSAEIVGGLSWFPGVGLIYNDGKGEKRYSGGSWSVVRSLGGDSYHDWSEYNSTANVLIFGGGNGSSHYKMTAGLTVTSIATAPFGIGAGETGQGVATSDPRSDRIIARNSTSGAWAQYDISADSWTTLTQSSGSGASPQTGTPNLTINDQSNHAIACAVPEYGVLVYIQYMGSGSTPANVWVYKHS